MKKKLFKRLIIWLIVLPLVLFTIITIVVYAKQDSIVQELIGTVNADFEGKLEIADCHISPFANFPYISIDLEQVKIFEFKDPGSAILFDVNEMYIGFSIWDILSGKFNIKAMKLDDGYIKLVQHKDGTINIANALSNKNEIDNVNEEFHLDIRKIKLKNIDLIKINEENNVMLVFYVTEANSSFKTSPEHVNISMESKFELSIISNGDSTFVKHKHFKLNTQLDFVTAEQMLYIKDSEVKLENALFQMQGKVDLDDNMNFDLTFDGKKPNFDLFLAFAPAELAPTMERYQNGGNIYFNASIKGKSINGFNPTIEATFGCEKAFFNNIQSEKKIDDLFFKGHFSTGSLGTPETMEFSLTDINARPETGTFSGSIYVKNFVSPEIDMKVKSEFELDFLAQFLNVEQLQDLHGHVALTMNFHDIIDFNNPEKSIEKLNESYFTELEVKDLGFRSPGFHLPIEGVNIRATMDGHEAHIDKFDMKIGNSDLHLDATVSDLPAILHHTKNEITSHINFTSNFLDIYELSSGDTTKSKPVNEQIKNMSMKLTFTAAANAFTEFKNLPKGEFFIDDFYAQMLHYPHTLHDFHADIFVNDEDFSIVDFTGMIDKSDFHFSGVLQHYDLWFAEVPMGDTKLEFNLHSDLLQLEDLFSYQGENYVPEDYRHEELRDLNVHGVANLHFADQLKSSDITIDKFQASMKLHPMKLERFNGRIHLENEHLLMENFSGKLGKSDFVLDMNIYLGDDEALRKRDNFVSIKSTRLDFDELLSYNPPPPGKITTSQEHDSVFSFFDLPFTDIKVKADIKQLNYHRLLISDLKADARMQKNHYIYLDTLSLNAAGGSIELSGYFNGSDRNNIYLSPIMKLDHVNLDKLLFKFENFGQDHLVSENLHGEISGALSGKVHLHADLVPIIDDSEIHFDMLVTNGRLENYSAFEALADYFSDKNLNKVLFDTLSNHIDIKEGMMSIPAMTINSTLGFIEISGKQDMNLNMEYYVRIPVKMATKAGLNKLFGNKAEVDPEHEDEIVYRDENKRTKFINVKITGTPDDYTISMGKDKNNK